MLKVVVFCIQCFNLWFSRLCKGQCQRDDEEFFASRRRGMSNHVLSNRAGSEPERSTIPIGTPRLRVLVQVTGYLSWFRRWSALHSSFRKAITRALEGDLIHATFVPSQAAWEM